MSEALNPEVVILNAALALPANQRAAFLDQACAGDAALRRQVEDLLQAHDRAQGFLDVLPPALAFTRSELANLPLTEKPGDKIGRYKLLQQIGEGGCGVVYMAEQEEPVRRRVALKVIKLGMDTKEFVARFEAERQALALMDHPNIAKVFDAGATDTGRPYFVMELVRGIKITEFCDENKLSTEERLRLFIQVCQAIQHAHQKGVIHRDIKPSNILVTVNDGVPVPKVIDFGIAKATAGRLTDQTLFTAFEQFIGTPAYMSPEQAVMTSLDIDTRSDIYSLGVLLYQLLTGRTPFDGQELLKAGLDEMRRVIREKEPLRPSTRLSALEQEELSTTAQRRRTEAPKLIHLVRGDLDWIVMKCLEKDRARRYETANGLAADIRRHLNHEPILAHPISRTERLWRWCRRKPAVAGLAAALALLPVAVTIVSLVAASRISTARDAEKRERQRAETALTNEASLRLTAVTEASKSQQVAQFLEAMLRGVKPSVALGDDTTMLRKILDETARRLSTELTNQPAVEADLRRTIGQTYYALGEYAKAEAMFDRAVALRRKLAGPEDWQAGAILTDQAHVLVQRGDNPRAESLYREALDVFHKNGANEHADLATALNGLGNALLRRGDIPGAANTTRQALDMRRKLFGPEHLEVAGSLDNWAWICVRQHNLVAAESASREALAMRRKLLGPMHPNVAESLAELGRILSDRGNREAAVELARESVSIYRKILRERHPLLGGKLFRLGDRLHDAGQLAEAETVFREALDYAKESEDPDLLGLIQHHLAATLRQRGLLSEARTVAQQAAAAYWRNPGFAVEEFDHANRVLLEVLNDLRDDVAIDEAAREAVGSVRGNFGHDPPKLADRLSSLAGSLRHIRNQHAAAEVLFRELIQSRQRYSPPGDLKLLEDKQDLADVLCTQGWHERTNTTAGASSPSGTASRSPSQLASEAERLLRECLELFPKSHPLEPWRLPSVKSALGFSLLAQAGTDRSLGAAAREGKFAEGEALLLDAIETMLGPNEPTAKTIEYLQNAAERLSILYETWENYPAPPPAAQANAGLRRAEAASAAQAGGTAPVSSDPRAADNKWLLDDILTRERREHTNDPAVLAAHLEKTAYQLANRGNLIVAEALYREVLAMHTNASPTPLVRSFAGLSMILEGRGALDEAETVSRQAVTVLTNWIGDDHSSVGTVLHNLSVFLTRRDRFSEAETLARHAVAIAVKHDGEDSGRAASNRDQLASVIWNIGDHDGAEQLYRQSLELVRRSPRTDPIALEERLASLTDTLIDRHKFAEAEPLARELLQLRRARLPAEDDDVAAPAVTLGGVLAELAWPRSARTNMAELAAPARAELAREAERLLRECLIARFYALGEQSTRVAETRSRLGVALLALVATDDSLNVASREAILAEAEVLLRNGFEGLRQIGYAKASSRRKAVFRLIRLYEAREMLRQATEGSGVSGPPRARPGAA